MEGTWPKKFQFYAFLKWHFWSGAYTYLIFCGQLPLFIVIHINGTFLDFVHNLSQVLLFSGFLLDLIFYLLFFLQQYIPHCLYRFLDGQKNTRFQFIVPGLREIHRNLKQKKNSILARAFLENPLFVLFPA